MTEKITDEMCSELTQEDVDQLQAALDDRKNALVSCEPGLEDLILTLRYILRNQTQDGGELGEPTAEQKIAGRLKRFAEKVEAGEPITTTTVIMPYCIRDDAGIDCRHRIAGNKCGNKAKPFQVRNDATMVWTCEGYESTKGHVAAPEVEPEEVRKAAEESAGESLTPCSDECKYFGDSCPFPGMETGDPCDKFEEIAGESLVEMLVNANQLAYDAAVYIGEARRRQAAAECDALITKVIAAIEKPSE